MSVILRDIPVATTRSDAYMSLEAIHHEPNTEFSAQAQITIQEFGGSENYTRLNLRLEQETDTSACFCDFRIIVGAVISEVWDTNKRGMFIISKCQVPGAVDTIINAKINALAISVLKGSNLFRDIMEIKLAGEFNLVIELYMDPNPQAGETKSLQD